MGIKVYLLDYGYNLADNSIFIAGESPGKRVKIPVMGALIDHPDAKILVDTGVMDLKQTAAVECQYKQEPHQTVVEQLKKHGLKIDDIDYLVITHLHWDHAGGIPLFKNNKVIVRREELKEAFVPMTKGDMNYNKPDFSDDIDWTLLPNGVDFELVKGVKILSVPGHTAGTQNLLVETDEGPVIYAADSVYWYRNWKDGLLPGICYNAEDWSRSLAKMKAVYGVTIIPGHEPTIDVTRVYG